MKLPLTSTLILLSLFSPLTFASCPNSLQIYCYNSSFETQSQCTANPLSGNFYSKHAKHDLLKCDTFGHGLNNGNSLSCDYLAAMCAAQYGSNNSNVWIENAFMFDGCGKCNAQ